MTSTKAPLLRRRILIVSGLITCLGFMLVTTLPDLPTPHDPGGQTGTGVINVLGVNGELIARRGSVEAEFLALDELPEYLPAAVLAIEDRRFQYHPGIDPIAVVRAFQANRAAGRIVQGGSTITQQTAKLMFLDAERTWQRKWRELLLALSLELEYTKDEILELYLNRAYLGSGNYGVEMASWDYFGKSARDVTLPEAAMLAGLLQAPSRYAPTRDPAIAQRRAGVVLDAMVEMGVLDSDVAAASRALPAALAPPLEAPASSYFVDWIFRQLPDSLSNLNIDLNVITTLDPHAQSAAEIKLEQVIADAVASGTPGIANSQAAMVILTPDGAIRAMTGGRSYKVSQFNRATDARRQPGSAFKPFVYMAAMEQGYAPENLFYDEPVTVDDWSPENYAGEYLGRVTLAEALAGSINSVAVKLSEAVGREAVIATARRSGIESQLKPVASLPLGTHELSLLELTAAYAPFANGGYRARPYGLLEVRTVDGTLLYKHDSPVDTRVAGRRVVRDMNRMLSATVSAGTGRAAALPGRPVAGKTGTSQNASDAWFVGYTAELVAGVWMGFDDNSSMGRMTGGRLPARAWAAVLAAAHPVGEAQPLPFTDAEVEPRGDMENLIVRALDESPRPDIYIPGAVPRDGFMRLNPDR